MHRRTVVKAAAATGLAALFGAVATTRAGAATQISERVFDLSIASAALGRSAPVRLILPTDFDARPTRTWPVLYLLHGAHDDYNSWTRETDIEAFTEGLGLIVAMPDGGPTGIPTKWRDGTDYETFQLTEVHAVLRSDYRASTVRAVAGVSTGGYGAIAHAARHPGAFAAAASYSGILDTTLFGVPPLVDAIVARENVAAWSLWGNPVFQYATWRDYNPRVRASALSGTPLYVSNGSGLAGGTGDLLPEALESALWPSAHSFTSALNLLRIPVTTHYYSGGGHSWAYWQPEFRASWPILASALGL
ncbi:alpha/beta hydrolase [Streptomyces sp. NPDC000888]